MRRHTHSLMNDKTTNLDEELEMKEIPPPAPLSHSYRTTRSTSSNVSLSHLDYHVPAILAVHAIHSDEYSVTNPITQLTIFVQGAQSKRHGFYMNVKACIIGDQVVPIARRLINVFVCRVTFQPEIGDRISLVLGSPVFRKRPWRLGGMYRKWELDGSSMQNGRRAVRSEMIWGVNVGLDVRREREKVWEVCAMFEDKETDVQDVNGWVEYHRRIGVDRVFIYDNNVNSNVLEREFEDKDDVEVVYWPWRKSQEIAQNHFLVLAKTRCKWVVMCDVDEYVMVRPHEMSLRMYLRHLETMPRFGGVQMPALTMGSSGHVHRPNGSVVESYMHRINWGDRHKAKSIGLASEVVPQTLVHYLPLRQGRLNLLMKHHPERSGRDNNYIFIVHYNRRSWEDFFKKNQLGRSALEVDDWTWGKKEPDFLHKVYASRLRKHVDLRWQVEYREFHSVWKEVMKRAKRIAAHVLLRKDVCVTCWYQSSFSYKSRRA